MRGSLVRNSVIVLMPAATLIAMVACGLHGATNARDASYAATLTGAQEQPRATGSTVTGSATVTVTGDIATYVLTTGPFATAVTAAHIHIGGAGTVGPVVVPLPLQAQSGAMSTGTIDLGNPITFNTLTISGDSLRALLNAGTTYVNVHTAAWPDGEIRGQLTRR